MRIISTYLGALMIIINLKSVISNTNTTTIQTTTTTATTGSGPTTVTDPPLGNYGYEVHCKFQPDGYQCDDPGNSLTKWYYDIKMEDCKVFQYYKCQSANKNIFNTYDDCRQACREPGDHVIEYNLPANAACIMQPDFGDCRDYIPMYYYDMSTSRCYGFAFSGCGGNQNRFYNDKDCQKVCLKATEKLIKDKNFNDNIEYK